MGFLEVWQGYQKYIGLIDCGADINCIGDELCNDLKYSWLSRKSTVIKGIGGGVTTGGLVEIQFNLETGNKIIQPFAIMKHLKRGIIFGLPFLSSIKAIIDIGQGIIGTCFGNLEILYGFSVTHANHIGDKLNRGTFIGVTIGINNQNHSTIKEQKEESLTAIIEGIIAKTDLEGTKKKQLEHILLQFSDLWTPNRRGVSINTKHNIKLTTQQPLSNRPRRFSMEQQKIIEEEVVEMEQQGIIEDSNSPYVSDIVLVKKTTGEWRVCIDYRLINNFTIDDKYPLPPIQELIHNIRNSKFFVTLDLRSGYWQISMDEKSKLYTAFRTPRGLKQFKVMPFGLKNAPATFQRMMNEMLGDLYWKGVLVYLDDILIHGRTVEEVFTQLKEVFNRFRQANLILQLKKCNFFLSSIKYLGFIISEGIIRPDPQKVEALNHVKTPSNLKELRSLLGLLGFYRQFISHYSSKAAPLTKLLKKNEPFIWGPSQQVAMRLLINGLKGQVLANPEINEILKLETDASGIAIGAVLSCSRDGKHWRPIEFMSKTLTDTQQRWPTHEREAWAIVAALEKFDCYLRGKKFDVYTDNSSLQWMNNIKIGKISRWAARMAEYSMTIKHISNKKMEHVDFLSRYINPIEEGLAERMTVWMADGKDSIPSIEKVVTAQKHEPPRWGKGFASRNGIIFYRSKYYAPPSVRMQIVAAGHIINPLIHGGMRKTKSTISKVFRWPRMELDINKYIQGCLPCQRVRPGIESLQGLVRHHGARGVFEKVYIDVWSVKLRDTQYKCLTMVDSLTRWAEVEELKDETANIICQAFFSTWVCRFGAPKEIVTDQGKAFTGEVFNKWCHILGCHHIKTTAYHPQGNAIVETFHRYLNKGLSLMVQRNSLVLNFREAISLILMGYRSTFHSTVEDSPAYLTFGVDIKPAEERDWVLQRCPQERDRRRILSLIRFELMAKCQQRADLIEKAGLGNREKLTIGDLVLLHLPFNQLAKLRLQDGSLKIQPKWSLPFRVLQVSGDGQSAILRNLVTHHTTGWPLRQAHIRDIRFISPPCDEHQRQLWEEVLIAEQLTDVRDPKIRRQLLNEFWEKVGDECTNKRVRIE